MFLRSTTIVIALLSTMRTLDAKELPRYRLDVGQELIFVAENELTRLKGMSKRESITWTIWVVGKNGNGKYPIVARRDYSARYSDATSSLKDRVLEYAQTYRFELGSDGCIVFDPKVIPDSSVLAGLRTIFPLLPKDDGQVRSGYVEENQAYDEKCQYRIVSGKGNDWQIEAESTGLAAEIYEIDSKNLFNFDGGRGLLLQARMASTQKSLLQTKLEGTLKLKSDKNHGSDWAASMAREFDRYFAAKLLVREATADEVDGWEAAEKARDAMKSAQALCKVKLIQERFESDLKVLENEIKYRKQANAKTKLLGKTVNWETVNIDGDPVKLTDFKGKVVVLDYWYRGCFWCIRAMPQLNELTTYYKDKPVAVLGMNRDEDLSNARFVIKKMSLNYPTLKALKTDSEYGVYSYPTILILNEKGECVDCHHGYSPVLKDILIKKIDKVLSAQK